MKYHIHYVYESKYGRTESYVYKETLDEARENIRDHWKNAEHLPRLVKVELFELMKEADNDTRELEK